MQLRCGCIKRITQLKFSIMNWTNEDVKFVEKAIEIRNKGYYLDGGQLTEVYNRVLNKRAASTSCGSCIRQRINELEGALNQFRNVSSLHSNPLGVSKKLSETKTEVKVDNTKEEENKAVGNASSLHSNTIGMSRKAGKKK